MSILIKSILHKGKNVDIYIVGNKIKKTGESLSCEADKVIDGHNKAIIPGFVNTHTHAAMTLFRGYGDDMALMPWLKEKIWPNEAKLTPEDVYWCSKLACLEMIKSGTTAFYDMYYMFEETAKAVEETGIRALLSEVCFDNFDEKKREKAKSRILTLKDREKTFCSRVKAAIGPHAIYTVSGELLQWTNDFSKDNNIPVSLHLAETTAEVEQCKKDFGTTPVRYLKKLGILSPRLTLAHVLYVDKEEISILADYGVNVVHNPASNMKLASGYKFKYEEMRKAGINIGLGTDGCSSSNNLDMIEAMKLASLLGKVWRRDPEAMTCDEMLHAATLAGAEILDIDAGKIEEGHLADVCLIDIKQPVFTPNYNFVSNLVFAANGSCVDTVICDGKVVMENRIVTGEDEILEKAAKHAYNLIAVSNFVF
jgi:5-methylthioadenosine/S-adenosylhomocysteine deaminase